MDTPRYINPLTDFGFKRIFGDEEIMRDFLNDAMAPDTHIVELSFIDKEMMPETKYERGIIYDMRCKLDNGEEVIVEMQNRGQDYFSERIVYYLSRAIVMQGEKGDGWKYNLHNVYGVFFMNFFLDDKSPRDIRHVALIDTDTQQLFTKTFQFWLMELPRFRTMTEADCKTNIDYWLYILTHSETIRTNIPFQSQKPIFH